MSKIPEWLKSDGLDDKEIEDMCCPNGSFSCGLFKALGMKMRCNLCKRDAVRKANKENEDTKGN